MIASAILLKDLQKRVTLLEEDLRRRCDADPHVNAPFQAQYAAARASKRTAETFNAWRDEQITQMAVAWVLACVFVRFLEDNQLLDTPFLAGPDAARMNCARDEQELFFKQHPTDSERDYLLHVFDAVGQLPGMREFFDRRHNPLWLAGPTGDALAGLLDFWRKTDPDTGTLVHDFSDPRLFSLCVPSGEGESRGEVGESGKFEIRDPTRFLGDLYQDLSEFARKRYALLQTPEFVEKFILDRTLTPAIDTFGYREVRMLDMTCGSGHFLLGGFGRLFKLWQEHEPGENPRVLAQRALDQVCGVDLNPNVVAIARFRLLLAALKACQPSPDGPPFSPDATPLKLKAAPDFKIHLAVGDSLLHGARFHLEEKQAQQQTFGGVELFRDELQHFYDTEDRDALHRILGRQYHVVVGNPPYITVKDKALKQLYRDRFDSCHRTYSLAAPFMERLFDFTIQGEPAMKWDPFAGQRKESDAQTGQIRNPKSGIRNSAPAGYVGMITANSFMKREFGKKLIEECIPRWDLTHVIDTSGAYIPGHGTPTVILFGKHQPPVAPTIRTVMGIKGEPATPEDPAHGLVWTAILRQLDQPGSESEFVSVSDSQRQDFHKHPWTIGGGGATELLNNITSRCPKKLSDFGELGIAGWPGIDEVMVFDPATARRYGLETNALRPFVAGDNIRDWLIDTDDLAIVPYSSDGSFFPPSSIPRVVKCTWYYRTLLNSRVLVSGETMGAIGMPPWAWVRWNHDRVNTACKLSFAFIATHNHFALIHDNSVMNRSAPVFVPNSCLPEQDRLTLLGVLNSSLAAFWLRQMSYPKATTTGDISVEKGKPEANRYEFSITVLERFPICDTARVKELGVPDLVAEILANTAILRALEPSRLIKQLASSADDVDWRASLRSSCDQHEQLRLQLVFLQEELDWRIYDAYGIQGCTERPRETIDHVGVLCPERRPFEWLEPRQPCDGADLAFIATYQARRRVIDSSDEVRLLEQRSFKRLWLGRQGVYGTATRTRAERVSDAARDWLLCRLEGYFFGGDRVCRLEDGFSPAAHGLRATTQPALVSTNQLAEVVQADAAFLKVAEVYVGAAGFSVPKLVREVVESESVPFLPFQRYKESGLRKRQDWEGTWELQRREDAIEAEVRGRKTEDGKRKTENGPLSEEQIKALIRKRQQDEVGVIPVPPKYSSADFKSSTFWRLRGKLDVPKERWIRYPGAECEGDPSPVIAWAGWNHLQQAQALAEYYITAKDTWGWSPERLTLLLAGLADLLPWLKQWHNDLNPEYGMGLGDYFAGFLDEECRKNRTTVQATEGCRFWKAMNKGVDSQTVF